MAQPATPARWLPPLGWWVPVLLTSAALVAASQASSPLWAFLIVLALVLGALLALSGSPLGVLFAGYACCVTIEITKGLQAEGGVYAPGLYLSLSDLFLLPLLLQRVGDYLLVRRRMPSLHPIVWAALLWLAWQWYCVLKSPVGLGSVYSGLNQTKYFLAMWVVADHLRGPVQWRQFVRGIAIGLALHAAISVLQMVTGGALQVPGIKASTQQTLSYAGAGLLEVFRPSGLLSHPNALADYLVMIIPAMLGMALLGRRHVPGRYAGWLAALAAAFLMMLLTLSRGGWVATTAGVAVYLVLGYLRGTVTKAHLRRVGIAGLVGMIFAVAAFPTVWLRLFEADNRSTQSRLLLAEQALLIVQRNPIDGVGLGAYTWAAQRNLPDSYGRVPESFRDMLLKGVVHNKYLLTAAETGIIGLLLFLNVFRRSMSALWRADFRADPVREVVALGTLSGLVAVLVTFIVEHSYLGVPIETAWVAMGAAAALTTRQPAPAQSAVAARSR